MFLFYDVVSGLGADDYLDSGGIAVKGGLVKHKRIRRRILINVINTTVPCDIFRPLLNLLFEFIEACVGPTMCNEVKANS